MANAPWPPSLPQNQFIGVADTRDKGAVRTTMDAGPAKMRRRFSAVVRAISCPIMLTAAQKAMSGLISDNSGWGFGVAVVTRREHISAPVGSYGWAGGLGTSWRSDPSEDMVVILLTQASWTSLVPGRVSRDFGILAYQAIDD